MPRFTPSAQATETTNWEGGDYFTAENFRDEVGQNIEYVMQSHNHDGDLGDGGTIPTADPKALWFYAQGGISIL